MNRRPRLVVLRCREKRIPAGHKRDERENRRDEAGRRSRAGLSQALPGRHGWIV